MEETEREIHIRGLDSAVDYKLGQKISAPCHYEAMAEWYHGRLKSLKLDDLDKLGDEQFNDIVYWAITVLSRKYFCEDEGCQIGVKK